MAEDAGHHRGIGDERQILDTLAEVCFRRGKVAEAIQIEERALAMDPESKYLGKQLERFRGKR